MVTVIVFPLRDLLNYKKQLQGELMSAADVSQAPNNSSQPICSFGTVVNK